MGTQVQPEIYTPAEWQRILHNARIALRENPQDQEAMAAVRDAEAAFAAMNQADHANAQEPQGDRSVLGAAGGVLRGLADIPQAMYTAVRHPINTLGQMTGVGNWGNIPKTFSDPEANWAEKLDAIVRGTPFNMGYAPQRAVMDAMSDPEASNFDRSRKLTNVASLALFGLGKPRGRTARLSPRDLMPPGDMSLVSSQKPPVSAPPTRPVNIPPFEPAGMPEPLNPLPVGVNPRPRTPNPLSEIDNNIARQRELLAQTEAELAARKPLTPALEPIPGTGGRGFMAEGPPLKPVTPAMEAFSEVRTGSRMQPLDVAIEKIKTMTQSGVEALERQKPQGSGGTGQKSVTFGEESPLSPATRAEVKGLLGEISRGPQKPGSMGELMQGLGEGNTMGGGFLGFSVGPFLAWEIMRRTIRPGIDKMFEGINPMEALQRVQDNPKVQALQSAMIKAYMAGQAEQARQAAEQLAQVLMQLQSGAQ